MINNITEENIEEILQKNITSLYINGPSDNMIMEEIAYCKMYYNEIFSKYEQELLYAMGMFFKIDKPTTLFEKSINIFREAIKDKYGYYYTPNQTLIRKNIEQSLFYSFSAPTSAGKSHVFRDIIKEATKDIVVIVPSRALISEYYLSIIEMVSKDVLVLTFVDDINRLKTKKRIFILTPERATELFKYKNRFNIELFLFDEAQITEEKIRGLKFDALVRRTIKEFPSAKKVFAHPFIENPEVHFNKHNITENRQENSFKEKTIGQLFFYSDSGHYYLYSPYEKSKRISPVRQDDTILNRILLKNGTILIYLTKTKIYNLKFLDEFKTLINAVPEINDKYALSLIEELRNYLGAGKTERGKQSLLINLMRQGIVLHHGSVPLKGRLIIEKFIKSGYARICFATSTLLRGINMPFDVVYIDNFRNMTALDFKNLIGRAGRTNEDSRLNVGYICCSKDNINRIVSRINESCKLQDINNLDAPIENIEDDEKDIVEAIQKNEFIDELNIPKVQLERLVKNDNIHNIVNNLIELLIPQGHPISGEEYVNLPAQKRNEIKDCFATVYVSSLRNQELTSQEKSVLSTSLHILLWRIQGKSFRETVQLRYNYLTRKKEQKQINKDYELKKISLEERKSKLKSLSIQYTQIAFTLPNKSMGRASLFPQNTPIDQCDYDRLIYDTYDYLDKVISLSITDPVVAALEIYYQNTKDLRARALQNYLKYGTNGQLDIMLLRYGFDFEDFDWLMPCINSISEDGIEFNDHIKTLTEEQYKQIERYI